MTDKAGFGIVPRYLRGTLSAYEIALYVALSWRADQNGVSWAGQATLAKDAGMSRSTVQRALNGLEAKGLVKSQPWANAKGRSSNVYALRVWADPTLSESTITRQDGHPMKVPTAHDQAERSSDVPSQGTVDVRIPTEEVPSQGIPPVEPVGMPLTDADPRVSQTQRKKNQKNETQSSPPPSSSLRSEESSEEETPFQKLVRWPGHKYLAIAGARWKYLTAEKTWELTQKYADEVRAKGWHYSEDGWLKFMEKEDEARERRTKGRAYAPNGVPL